MSKPWGSRQQAYGATVTTANDAEMAKAEQILNDCGAVDIDEKAASWRKEGWTGGAEGAVDAAMGDAKGHSLHSGSRRDTQAPEGRGRARNRQARGRQGWRAHLHPHD